MNRGLAVRADKSDQPLRKDAVESRDEVVRLDTHVEKSSEHVEHVVRVYGGENKVSGERGVDGNLCRFLVANFADHHLVGIVSQNRPKTAGEGQTLLFVYRDL